MMMMETSQIRRSQILTLETDYVHSAYDNIAPHLCQTKHKAWPRVVKFLQDLPPGALVADVGCGSGRYLDINMSTFTLGSDRCYRFVQASTHKLSGPRDVMVCDNLHLPYKEGLFDAVISIGVIHHLSSSERRGQALNQLSRLLSPGGRMMIYVWAMEQKKRKFDGQDVLIPWSMQTRQLRKKGKLLKQVGRSSSSLSDDESSTPTSACSQLDPVLRAQKRHLCQDIVNFVSESRTSKNGTIRPHLTDNNKEKLTSIFDWLNNTDKKKPLFIGKSGSDAQINDVMANQSRHVDDVTSDRHLAGSQTVPRSQSVSERIKAQLINLVSSEKPEVNAKLDNDVLYQQLIDHITNNDAHIFDKPWPPLDVEMLDNTFKVREFPLSSFPTVSPLTRLQQTLSRKSPEDSTFLSDDDDDISDDVFENVQLELGQVGQTSPDKTENGFSRSVDAAVNGRQPGTGNDEDKIKRPDSIKLKTLITQNGHNQNKLDEHPDFTLITRPRISSDPVLDTPSALSNGISGSHSNLSPWIQDGYSADESSLNSSFADLSVERDQNQRNQSRHLRRKPKSHHLHAFLAQKAHSFDAPSRKEKPRNGLKMAASLDTDSDVIRDCEEKSSKTTPVYHRYYHVFRQGELIKLVEKYAPDCSVVDVYFDHGNWCVVAEKVGG